MVVFGYDDKKGDLRVVGSPGTTYRIVALWQYVPATPHAGPREDPGHAPLGSWESVPVPVPSFTVRFSTSQPVVSMRSLLAGRTLFQGTYYARGEANEANGIASGQVVNNTPAQCQDIMLRPAASGAVAACVGGAAVFVPDPAELSTPAK